MNKNVYSNYVGRIAYDSGICQAELEEKVNRLTPAQMKILDYLLTLSNSCPNLFPNQTTLGKKAGVTRRQSNRLVKQLYEMRLIDKITRPNLACVYFIASIFLLPSIRQRFSKKFSAFKWLSLVMLFSGIFQVDVSGSSSAVLFINPESEKTMDISSVSICKREKRSLLKMYSSPERSKLILEISKEFNLNRLGQIKLSPYPIQALQYAHEKFQTVKNPKELKSVFHFFVSVCNEWCERYEVPIDWKTSFDLMEQHALARDGNVYADQTQSLKKQNISTQKPSGDYQSSPLPKREYQKRPFSAKPTHSNQSGRAFDKYAEQLRTHDPRDTLEYGKELMNRNRERHAKDCLAAGNMVGFRNFSTTDFSDYSPIKLQRLKEQWGLFPLAESEKQKLYKQLAEDPDSINPLARIILKEWQEESLAKSQPVAIPSEDPRPFGIYEESQNSNEDQI